MRFACLIAALLPLAAAANPTGGTVTSGSATISASGTTTTITTNANGTIINWTSFSISTGETTRFNQPSAASATLNRVTGPSSSSINGSLQSNGQVFLSNPNGVLIGAGGQVSTAGFVASTLGIADADFLAGNYRFTANGTPGAVVNNGSIVASDAFVALIAPSIQSAGSISTGAGGIALLAGDTANLTVSGGILAAATAGSAGGNPTIDIQGTLTSSGTVIVVAGVVNIQGPIPLPPPPVVILPPGVTLQPTNTSTGGSTSTGTGAVVSVGNLLAMTAGAVALKGVEVTSGASPAAVTSVALNLEKREVSF